MTTRPTRRQLLGERGEQLAADYLRARGYTIVAANWRSPVGEIDLVAQQGETLVFVEVKTRTSPNTETAFASITPRKRATLTRMAYKYLNDHGLDDALWRVDVIAIALPRNGKPTLEHVENALDW
jgi:putative endonuclease